MATTDDVAIASRGKDLARYRGLLGAGRAADVVRALGAWPKAELASHPAALVVLADAHLVAGSADGAIASAREAVACAPAGDAADLAGAVLALSLASRADRVSLDEARWMLDALIPAAGGRHDAVAARIHHADGAVRLREGRLDEARLALLDALAIATTCGDDGLGARLHDTLAAVHLRLGDVLRALGHHDASLRARTKLGDVAGRTATHRSRGRILVGEGRPDAALAEYDACVELSHQVQDAHGLALTLAARGVALTDLRRFDEADAALRAALRIAESGSHAGLAAVCTRDLAVLAERRGLLDDAIALAANAVTRFEAAGDAEGAGAALTVLGRLRARSTGAPSARAPFERAIATLRTTARPDLVADALVRLAESAPDYSDSPALLDEAGRIAREWIDRRILREVQRVRELLPAGTSGVRAVSTRNFVVFGRDRRDYHLAERLGKGGQGEAWKAFDAATGRAVAVKLRPVTDRTDEDRLCFDAAIRDLDAARRLDHRGVARVHDFERVGRELFVATDLLAGPDLRAHMRGGPPEPAGAWAWIADLAAATDALHAAGIVHRDLRPENVLFDASGRPVVVDLGFALLADRRGLLTNRVTGAPGYAAPEQWTRGSVDHRADLFALGAIAVELLTGRNFLTDGAVGRSTAEHVALMQDAGRVAALAAGVAWPAHVAPAARASLLRLVEPDPAARPASAGAAIAACRGV